MKLAPLHYATVAALTATLMLAGCKKDEPVVVAPPARTAPAPAPAPMPRAATASVTQVQLGNTAGPDGRVTMESNSFAPSDTVTASVSTNTSDPMASVSGTLSAKWTYQDGQVINEQQQSFSFTGPGVTNFQISKPDGWPAGNYTLTVSLDGKPAQTLEFFVR